MDEAIELLRASWREGQLDYDGKHYRAEAIAMEPKPPQGGSLPIWIGGLSKAALRRTGRMGDGWMGSARTDDASALEAVAEIRRHAEAAGRDPDAIGLADAGATPQRRRRQDLLRGARPGRPPGGGACGTSASSGPP